MLPKIISGLLVIAGIIHLLPLSGVLGAERLAALYGLSFQEPNLLLLMRSRAVLFGLLGAFLLYAAWRPALQPLALLGGMAGVVYAVAVVAPLMRSPAGEYLQPFASRLGRIVPIAVLRGADRRVPVQR